MNLLNFISFGIDKHNTRFIFFVLSFSIYRTSAQIRKNQSTLMFTAMDAKR